MYRILYIKYIAKNMIHRMQLNAWPQFKKLNLKYLWSIKYDAFNTIENKIKCIESDAYNMIYRIICIEYIAYK